MSVCQSNIVFLLHVYYKLFLTYLTCSISTLLGIISLHSADVPLSNKQTKCRRNHTTLYCAALPESVERGNNGELCPVTVSHVPWYSYDIMLIKSKALHRQNIMILLVERLLHTPLRYEIHIRNGMRRVSNINHINHIYVIDDINYQSANESRATKESSGS